MFTRRLQEQPGVSTRLLKILVATLRRRQIVKPFLPQLQQ